MDPFTSPSVQQNNAAVSENIKVFQLGDFDARYVAIFLDCFTVLCAYCKSTLWSLCITYNLMIQEMWRYTRVIFCSGYDLATEPFGEFFQHAEWPSAFHNPKPQKYLSFGRLTCGYREPSSLPKILKLQLASAFLHCFMPTYSCCSLFWQWNPWTGANQEVGRKN